MFNTKLLLNIHLHNFADILRILEEEVGDSIVRQVEDIAVAGHIVEVEEDPDHKVAAAGMHQGVEVPRIDDTGRGVVLLAAHSSLVEVPEGTKGHSG